MRKRAFAAVLLGLAALTAGAREPIRLDASSAEAAEASWKQMVGSAHGGKKQKLLEAMLKINLAGVQSGYEVVGNRDLQSLGIARIRDKVAGMSAEEIIELGERVGTVKIERSGG
jgi:hypothetical protein